MPFATDLSTPSVCIGVDAGGTNTEILAAGGPLGQTPLRRLGPGVNAQRDGLDGAASALATMLRETVDALPEGAPVGSVCVGVAGAGRPADQEGLKSRLAGSVSGAPVQIVHDAALALEAAFSGASGLVVIAGTGSVVFARTEDGTTERAGGWGPRLGDDGSGTALGLQGLRAAAAALDGGPPTGLTDALLAHVGADSSAALIHHVHSPDFAPAELAPLVCEAAEAHDWVASQIVMQQANALAKQAGWLATRVEGTVAERAALFGGLLWPGGYYRECLAEALLRHLPSWRIVQPELTPAEGAVRIAAQALEADPA